MPLHLRPRHIRSQALFSVLTFHFRDISVAYMRTQHFSTFRWDARSALNDLLCIPTDAALSDDTICLLALRVSSLAFTFHALKTHDCTITMPH